MDKQSKPEIFKMFFSADVVGSTKYKQPFEAGASIRGHRESGEGPNGENNGQKDEGQEDKMVLLRISNKKTEVWKNTIQNFYLKIDEQFKKEFREKKFLIFDKFKSLTSIREDIRDNLSKNLMGNHPRIWKTIGDEVVFWKKVDCPEQVVFSMICWLNALGAVREEFLIAGIPLDIKATVWCGEFQRRNKAIVLDHFYEQQAKMDADFDLKIKDRSTNEVDTKIQKYYKGENLSVVDFIGPAIDIGFRLSKFSSAKKMAISVDVAYLMCLGVNSLKKVAALSNEFIGFIKDKIKISDRFEIYSKYIENLQEFTRPEFYEIIPIHYSGSEQLKGVLGDIKYPFFWINTGYQNSLENVRDRLYLDDAGRRSVDVERLQEYLAAFYKDRSDYVRPPELIPLMS